MVAQQEAAMKIAEKKAKAKPEASPLSQIDIGSFGRRIVGILTRNFFNMKNVALGIAFMINILLLFYRASPINADTDREDVENEAEDSDDEGPGGDDEEEDLEEWVHVEQEYYYVEHVISIFAVIHALLSFCMVIAYYNLKVPLAVFKREKEVARRLEFDGLYLVEQPEDDDVKAHWDKLVISAKYVLSIYFKPFIIFKSYSTIFIQW